MSTALQLGPKGWGKYIKRQNHPASSFLTTEQICERNLLLNRIREAARRLKEQFSVRKVILFGSMAHQLWYSQDADVDMAVEGLADQHFWDAWDLLETVIQDRTVDLIELEKTSQPLREAIQRHGIELS
jgi:predicted nucleotidyltransferase